MTSDGVKLKVLAVLLAAGSGSRWIAGGGEGHKLTAKLPDGRVVFAAALDAAVNACTHESIPLIVVTGAADVLRFVPAGIQMVHNPNWADGQASSVQCAIRFAETVGSESIVVGLGDQPWMGAAAWRQVIKRLREPGLPIVIPTFDGVRGQPVGLRSSIWAELPASGDEGARSLIRRSPYLVEELVCDGDIRSLLDIDTPGDLTPPN
jgi:molybdenum cofactor cytidylyltransferase